MRTNPERTNTNVFIYATMYINKHDKRELPAGGDAGGLADAAIRAAVTHPAEGLLRRRKRDRNIEVVPITRRVSLPRHNPYALFRALGCTGGCILESMEGVPRRAVRSIICLEPSLVLTFDGDITCSGERTIRDLLNMQGTGNPLEQIREILGQFHMAEVPERGFLGGLVGYCAYDMVTGLSGGMVAAGREGPLARFMLCTRGIVYDHVQGSCLLFDDLVMPHGNDPKDERICANERMDALEEAIRSIPAGIPGGNSTRPSGKPALSSSMSREEYQEAVRKAKEQIAAGEIFQVVLSRRVSCPFQGDPLDIYGAIRTINPSPYLYFLRFVDEAVIGSSPEMLVKVAGMEVQTVPIAGTRPRGKDAGEDARLAADLLADPKEKAEHLMLVDLARNDIGKVAAFGSVRVPEYMEVEKFSHVQHIVSRVSGTLRGGCDRFDALAACFPAGTVSGAPKIRAMQIIAELEAHPRGLYAGAVGHAGFDSELEFAIAIRTIRAHHGRVEFSTGAGIVADSVPEREYDETEQKAMAMMRAVGQAGAGI